MINVISWGAGVQSSTMALMAAHGEIEQKVDFCIFADTGDEPQSVYDWIALIIPRLPFPVHVVSNRLHGRLSERELLTIRSKKSGKVYRKSGIPAFTAGSRIGMLPRTCTADFKITPIERELRKQLGIRAGKQSDVLVTQWIGISKDEAHRMKPSKHSWCVHRWPLIELGMTRQDCLSWMERNGYPKPPRSACIFCPYHSDAEWLRLKTDEPEEFEKAAQFEENLWKANDINEVSNGKPFLHRSCKPLGEIEFIPGQGELQFGNECEGMCGV